jgi:hypothetical protein
MKLYLATALLVRSLPKLAVRPDVFNTIGMLRVVGAGNIVEIDEGIMAHLRNTPSR